MAPLHRVYFLGNVIQDPEAWSAPNGTAVARCGLAVPTRLRQGDTWHADVCYIDVVAFILMLSPSGSRPKRSAPFCAQAAAS